MRFTPSLLAFYALLWLALAVCIPWPHEPRWEEVEEMFERNKAWQERQAEEIIESIHALTTRSGYTPDILQYSLSAEKRARLCWDNATRICDALEAAKKQVNSGRVTLDSLRRTMDEFLDSTLVLVDTFSRDAFRVRLPLQYLPSLRHDTAYECWSREVLRGLQPDGRKILLTALENNVRLSAIAVMNDLYTSSRPVCCWGCGWNPLRTIAFPERSFVLPGELVRGTIVGLAVYNLNLNPRIESFTGGTLMVKNGIGTWHGTSNRLGRHTIRGLASLLVDTAVVTKPWSFEYRILPCIAQFHLDQSNTLYRGLPTKISIHAKGYPPNQLSLHIPNVLLEKTGATTYLIHTTRNTPSSLTAYLSLAAPEGPDTICIQPIRARNLPPPRAAFGHCDEAASTTAAVRTLNGLSICTADEDFEAGLWRIQQYSLTRLRPGEEDKTIIVRGARWTEADDAHTLMASLRPGDRLLAGDILAASPDGQTTTLLPVSVRITD